MPRNRALDFVAMGVAGAGIAGGGLALAHVRRRPGAARFAPSHLQLAFVPTRPFPR
jgi:hypothetical protein